MDGYTHLVAGVLFPLHEALRGHGTTRRLRELEQSQWQSAESIRAGNLTRMKTFLATVGRDVPYYRDLFASRGFDARAMTSHADLAVLPILEKADIRAAFDQMRSCRATSLKAMTTGGSSGEPLKFLMGKARITHDVAAKWRATRWWGVDIGDPEMVVWGSPIELSAQDRWRRWRDRLFRSELIPAFKLDERGLAECLARIQEQRPAMLFGYPSALSLIGRHAEQRGWCMSDLGVKVAFVTAERLYEAQRSQISRTFGCPVANGYGGRDAGFVAHECPHGGMHLMAEDIWVEITDRAGRSLPPGVAGDIVVTHLASGDFPFIRYRTGDVGVLDDAACPCGRGLPLIREIQGRSTDFVVASDGTVMHGLALIYVLRDMPEVAQFRIIQESRAVTRVELVRGDGFGDHTIRSIQAGLRERLGQDVDIQVRTLPFLMRDASGKFRYVQSKVAA